MKKITTFVLFVLVTPLFFIIACNEHSINNKNSSSSIVSPDSLIENWNNAWNKHDSSAIESMFASQSLVVFSNKEKITGADSIIKKWVNKNLPQVANLKTEKITSSASAEMVYYSGNYSLDITDNATVVASDAGCFTTIWKLQNDNSWKIELMFFGESVK